MRSHIAQEHKEEADKVKTEQSYKCQFCKITFSQSGNLNRHIRVLHFNEKNYRCNLCNKDYGQSRDLKKHYKIHHPGQEMPPQSPSSASESKPIKFESKVEKNQCDFCEKEFSGKDSLQNHTCDRDKIVSCQKCGKEFTNIHNLKRHEQTVHEGVKSHQCEYCEKSYGQRGNLKIHFLEHHNDFLSDHKCNICKKVFPYKSDKKSHILKQHPNSEEAQSEKASNNLSDVSFNEDEILNSTKQDDLMDQEIHQCEWCEETFVSKTDIKNHIQERHSTKETECKSCQTYFEDKAKLDDHICSGNTEAFKCNPCGDKTFSHYQNLTRHVRVQHYGIKNLKCEKCDKAFAEKFNLRMHVQKCTGELQGTDKPDTKLHQCNSCEKSFGKLDDLKAHMKIHGKNLVVLSDVQQFDEKEIKQGKKITEFKCEFCEKDFDQALKLNIHIGESHKNGNAEDHKCYLCGKGFSHSPGLTRHLEVTHEGKTFNCKFCPSTFTRMYNLRMHTSKNHQVEDEPNLEPKAKKRKITHLKEEKMKVEPTIAQNIISKNNLNDSAYVDDFEPEDNEPTTYNCDLCDETFTVNTELKKHIKEFHRVGKSKTKTSTDENSSTQPKTESNDDDQSQKFKCDFCEKDTWFTRKCNLQIHVKKLHKEHIKDVKCDLCDIIFPLKASLEKHTKKLHKKKSAKQCNLCSNKFFTNSRGLKKHMKRNHAKVKLEKEKND